VTAGNARHGRRNNGLFAAEYAVVGDVDPRVGEHLLDVLGNRGIAAYLQPTADQHPITRITTLPGRPVDRLFADRRELSTAREFYALATSDTAGAIDPDGLNQAAATSAAKRANLDFEAAWESIVAGFDAPRDGGPTPWPASEDDVRGGRLTVDRSDSTSTPPDSPGPQSTPSPNNPTGVDAPSADPTIIDISGADATGLSFGRDLYGGGPTARPSRRRSEDYDDSEGYDDVRDRDAEPSLIDGLDTFGAGLTDDEDDNYHPPAPPPLPRFAGITVLAVVGIIVGIAVLISPSLLPVSTSFAAVLGCACIVGGGAALIARLRSGDEDDPDDPDHGAIV